MATFIRITTILRFSRLHESCGFRSPSYSVYHLNVALWCCGYSFKMTSIVQSRCGFYSSKDKKQSDLKPVIHQFNCGVLVKLHTLKQLKYN